MKTIKKSIGVACCIFFINSINGNASTASEKEESTNDNAKFSNRFLYFDDSHIDFNIIANNQVTPGTYKLDVLINDKKVGIFDIRLEDTGKNKLEACIPGNILLGSNLKDEIIPVEWKKNECYFINDTLTGLSEKYNYDDESLEISIADALLNNLPKDYVSPKMWDEGTDALSVKYNLSGSQTAFRNNTSAQYAYANIQTTMRLGAWRFNTFDSWNFDDNNGNDFSHLQAYAERAIAPLQANLLIGDLNTSGELFNTTNLRGIKLATDEQMLPGSMRGFAPVVRGYANSNALVTVKQGGNVLYERTVPAGEFIIEDLYSTGFGGDLNVTIKEANGATQTYSVPNSSVPGLLRPGYKKFAVNAGLLRDSSLHIKPFISEFTWQQGLNSLFTLYSGLQASPEIKYHSLLAGTALNTPIGAFGFDIQRSFYNAKGMQACDSLCKMAFRITYSKYLEETKTNFGVIGYRYASSDFYTVGDAARQFDLEKQGKSGTIRNRFKNRIEASITQQLSDNWGSFYVNGIWGQVWSGTNNATSNQSTYQLGYNNGYRSLNYSLALSRTFNINGNIDNTVYLSFSVPFGTRNGDKPYLNTTASFNSQSSNIRVGLNGSTGKENILSYGGYFSESSKNNTEFGMNMGYTAPKISMGGSYTQNLNGYSAALYSSGGFVLHSGGLNASAQLGDTFAIIHAPDLVGEKLENYPGQKINSNGYGILPSLTPYIYNNVTFNFDEMSSNEEVVNIQEYKVVPTKHAALKIDITAKKINTVMYQLMDVNKNVIPYGSIAYDTYGNNIGIVGQGGMITLDSVNTKTIINIETTKGNRCSIAPAENINAADSVSSVKTMLCKA